MKCPSGFARPSRRHPSSFFLTGITSVLLLLGQACTPDTYDFTTPINSALVLTPPSPSPVPSPTPLAPSCYAQRFVQPDAVITRKVDLLFMTDTSGSLDEERAAIADGIDAFVQALPQEVDLRIGTMLAHSSRSSRAGKLYYYGSNSAARVLNNQTQSMATIRSYLRNNLTRGPTDNYSDGGEIGTYAMTVALDDANLAAARTQGFFREDAALVVVFISDEQDICYDYPAGVTPVPDPQGSEAAAKARDCVRTAPARVVDGVVIQPSYQEKITPESVVRKLKELQAGRPLLVSAIAYNNPATLPRSNENEIGYGWIDMVRLASGVTVDLAGSRYEEGLQNIGTLASVKLDLQTTFAISRPDIDPASIAVKVDGVTVSHDFVSEFNQVTITQAGMARSAVDITYCDKIVVPSPSPSPSPSASPSPVAGVDALCTGEAFERKNLLKVGLSIDPSEGSLSRIQSGFTSIGVATQVYTDAEIAAGKPAQDGVTVLVIARKVVLQAVSAAYVSGIRSFIQSGGSILAEYDGAALLAKTYQGVQVSFEGHFTPSVGLLNGNVAGGGALLPIDQSTAHVIDSLHPVMNGVSVNITTGVRAAFAISGYDRQWLETLATFDSTGNSGSLPAGTFPAALAGRCGKGRMALFTMTHLSAMSFTPVQTMVGNALRWLIGDTN